jgi:hypothetical protein
VAPPDPEHTPSDASRLRHRRDEIDESLRRIDATLAALRTTNHDWVDRLQPIVTGEVAKLLESLAVLQGDSDAQWKQLSEIAAKEKRLASETLAFVGGLAARSAGLDRDACNLADRLLADVGRSLLVPYHAIAVPASAEYVDLLSEVIRVRYPGRGVWDLPVVLHEFGHFLVPRWRAAADAQSPSAIIEQERSKLPFLGAFAEELWADTFATYVGGPAYVSAALSRFDHTKADRDCKPTHPSAMKRAQTMFAALTELQAAWTRSGRESGSLQSAIDLTSQLWRARLLSVGANPELDEEARAYVGSMSESFFAILDHQATAGRFADGQRAAAIRRALLDGGPVPAVYSLLDVLNGAWWARQAAEAGGRQDRLAAITNTTVGLCANISTHGGAGP